MRVSHYFCTRQNWTYPSVQVFLELKSFNITYKDLHLYLIIKKGVKCSAKIEQLTPDVMNCLLVFHSSDSKKLVGTGHEPTMVYF
jgi:hypothetical protein